MRDALHERVDNSYKYIEYSDLPYRLQSIYCRCGNYSANQISTKNGGPPMCGNCCGVVRWFFFKCVKCETYFVQDFRHPKFCNFYPTCWKDTQQLTWKYCTEHKADPDDFPLFRNIVLPKGLNPKEYSAEELDNVFDF